MAIETKTVLKTYFESGDRPTQTQFANLIDSAVRDAIKAVADSVENDGFTGILSFKSSTSVTGVNTGTFGLRVLATETTADVAENIRSQLNLGSLTVLSTGANDTVVSVSGDNFEARYLNGRSINLTAQTTGDVFIAVNSTAWTRVPTSVVGTQLISNGAGELPSFEPYIYTTTIATLDGTARHVIRDLPSWPRKYSLLITGISSTVAQCDFWLSLGNSTSLILTGYQGTSEFDDTTTVDNSVGFSLLGVTTPSVSAIFNLCVELVAGISNDWYFKVNGQNESGSVQTFGVGRVNTSAQFSQLRLWCAGSTSSIDGGNLILHAFR